jgi:uncharacterized protein YndB with AHSA1/START domain
MKDQYESGIISPVQELVISRVFDAPRALVFKAWTEPERLRQWWGPKGFSWVVGQLDLFPGGIFHYCMRSPDGAEMWGRFVYLEIHTPDRLIFINSFSDEDGYPVKHPQMPDWPLEILNTLSFTEDQGRTILTLRAIPHAATAIECRTFNAGLDSIRRGFASTWKQLSGYLSVVH